MKARHFPLLILAVLCAVIPSRAGADGDLDYTFKDKDGNLVTFDRNQTFYSKTSPGPWKGLEAAHEPRVKAVIRKDGLEMTRVVSLEVSHDMEEEGKNGKIKAIYLLDKDGLVVGYEKFGKTRSEAKMEVWLNSVINYVEVYVECSQHGIWLKKIYF